MEMDIRLGVGGPGHAVQFYETAALLGDAVARFLQIGWRTGQPLVVVARESHQEAIHRSLVALGAGDLRAEIIFLDARKTLSTFMVNGRIDEPRFFQTAGQMFEQIRKTSQRRRILFYGEMVDVLWGDGNAESAVRLEQLWDGLAAQQSFSLVCGYAINTFLKDETDDRLDIICHLHDHVVAAMHDAPAHTEMARFRRRLQQRARPS